MLLLQPSQFKSSTLQLFCRNKTRIYWDEFNTTKWFVIQD